jgi:hypothetical protein
VHCISSRDIDRYEDMSEWIMSPAWSRTTRHVSQTWLTYIEYATYDVLVAPTDYFMGLGSKLEIWFQ